jgi:aminobenzoyl-glutamate utilization protein B
MLHFRTTLGLLLSVASLSAGGAPEAARKAALAAAESGSVRFGEISRQIWENPELGFAENKSSALLQEELRRAGFRVEAGQAGMPTAFVAEWGSGKPVIAVLAEYDGLPGMSQDEATEKRPRAEGSPGHACGHNLFGAASALAGIAVKDAMQKSGLKGTIRVYGTPAEEGGGGKIFMIRAGLFKDVDVSLAWHPADFNAADSSATWLATAGGKFRYYGKSAHAAAAPDAGRSALDALELTTHAINLLREHVPQETRIHYIITRGGSATNIVPDYAELSIYARNPDLKTLEGIWARILDCAKAGALATGTRVEVEVNQSYANMVQLPSLVSLMDSNLRVVGGVKYTPEERKFAESLRSTFDPPRDIPLGSEERIQKPGTYSVFASTDVGDVSWVVPNGHLHTATFPPGVPPHTWQSTAAAGSSIGRKGMAVAAKGLALTALDLIADPALVQAVKSDWDARMKTAGYRSLFPADRKPQLP